MIEKPNSTPICCGKPAAWVVLSANLSYFYCRECKNEVFPKKEVLKTDADDWHWNGGFLVGRFSFKEPNIMSIHRDPGLKGPVAQAQYGFGGGGYIEFLEYFE